MNFIIHYKVSFENQYLDGVTTVRNAANSTDAGITLINMIRVTAPGSTVEITATKQVSEEDMERYIQLIRL